MNPTTAAAPDKRDRTIRRQQYELRQERKRARVLERQLAALGDGRDAPPPPGAPGPNLEKASD